MSVRALLGGALVLTVGCREVIGIETRSEGPPLLALPEACRACVESACPELERACAGDPDCASLAACVAGKPDDPAGRAACEQAAPGAASSAAFLALDTCVRAPCQDDCTGIKGLLAGRSADCDTCLATACEPEYRACIAERACERTVTSAYTGPMTPPKAISVDNAPGIEGRPLRDLEDCLGAESCRPACSFGGTDFACTGEFEWPAAEAPSAELDTVVYLVDSRGTKQPVGGATHQVCEPLSRPCSPLKSTPTDAQGLATVTIPLLNPEPFRGYFHVFDPSPAPSILPMNGFVGRPFYASTWGEVVVFNQRALDFVALTAGTSPVEGLAQIVVLFLDCNGRPAIGVEVESDPSLIVEAQTKVHYHPQGGPPTATGFFYVLNAAPGCHELRGFVGADEIYRTRIDAQADVVTAAVAFPRSASDDPGYVCTPR